MELNQEPRMNANGHEYLGASAVNVVALRVSAGNPGASQRSCPNLPPLTRRATQPALAGPRPKSFA